MQCMDDNRDLVTTSVSDILLLLFQLEPLVNGPFTPDLANPISQLGKNAQEKGWPMDIKVGTLKLTKKFNILYVRFTCSHPSLNALACISVIAVEWVRAFKSAACTLRSLIVYCPINGYNMTDIDKSRFSRY